MDKDDNRIPLKEENIPALLAKHHDKIDRAVANDPDTQKRRLELFEHDPQKIAAHYPELQQRSEELREQNLAIQKTSATVGWATFAATAAGTAYAISKKKLGESKLIQSIVMSVSSVIAGLGANFITDRLLGKRVREESADLAIASRKAYERELAVYMEDTENRVNDRLAEERRKAGIAPVTVVQDNKWADERIKTTLAEAAARAQGDGNGEKWANDELKKAATEHAAQPAASHTASVAAGRASSDTHQPSPL